jgi:hypothetical protein
MKAANPAPNFFVDINFYDCHASRLQMIFREEPKNLLQKELLT